MGLFNRKQQEGRRDDREREDDLDREDVSLDRGSLREQAELPTEPISTRPTPVEIEEDETLPPAPVIRAEPEPDPIEAELRELDQATAAAEDERPAAAEAPAAAPSTGTLDKDELRRAVKGGVAAEASADDDEGRRSAAEVMAPQMKRKKHPFAPEQAEPAGERRMKVFAFANQKGGVAKTTTTLNLAVALSESGHRVLCVDLDPQGNLTMSQGIDPDTVEKSLYHVLVERIPIKEIIHHREVDIAVASIDLAGAEIAMSTQIGRERSLQKALADVADDYDFVCIDTPPSLGLLTINALTAAHEIIIPIQCEYFALEGLAHLLTTIELVRKNLNPTLQVRGLALTMFDVRTNLAQQVVNEIRQNAPAPVFSTLIPRNVRLSEAPSFGETILSYAPRSPGALAYEALAQELLQQEAAAHGRSGQ